MKKRKNAIIATMCILMLLMAIGYAYFATRLNISATGNITSNWNIYFSNITSGTVVGSASNNKTPSVTATTATMDANLALPGDSITYEITLTNGGTIGAIIEDIKAEASGSSAIIYSISGIKIGDKLAVGASKTITVKIEYDVNTTSQPSETSKALTVSIDAVQDVGQTITESDVVINENTLAARILNENTPQSDSAIDFSQSSDEDGTKGLYYTYTNTENNKITYYFRGTVENNYVKFGQTENGTCTYNGKELTRYDYPYETQMTRNFCSSITRVCDDGSGYLYDIDDGPCTDLEGGTMIDITPTFSTTTVNDIVWRIVRINEDGSVRLIKQESIWEFDIYSISGNSGVGYMYGSASDNYEDTHANINDSEIKGRIDEWYVNNLSSYSSYLADAGFCNDRSVSTTTNTWHANDTALGYGENLTYYGAYNRIVNLNKPQFACPNLENDLFTTNKGNKGNKALTYPIGLLTIDEAVYAGADMYSNNSYLNNGSDWLTISPVSGGAYGGYEADVFRVTSSSIVSSSYNATSNVRPVINLKSDVEFTLEGTGDAGTATNPYIIKTN